MMNVGLENREVLLRKCAVVTLVNITAGSSEIIQEFFQAKLEDKLLSLILNDEINVGELKKYFFKKN